ncbi:MAG: hypothetical protein Fur0037_00470 [Planctomycetota bacterium]
MSELKQCGEMFRQAVRDVGRRMGRRSFREALDRLLPEQQSRCCQVVSYRDGKLLVEVESGPLFAELSGFRREELRVSMNEILTGPKVAKLVFRMGGTAHA